MTAVFLLVGLLLTVIIFLSYGRSVGGMVATIVLMVVGLTVGLYYFIPWQSKRAIAISQGEVTKTPSLTTPATTPSSKVTPSPSIGGRGAIGQPPTDITPAGTGGNGGKSWWKSTSAYILYAFLFLYALLVLIGYQNTETEGVGWGLIALVASICHLIASIKTVGEQEIGVLIFLGKILGPLNSGPVFAPFPVRIRVFPKNTIQLEFGTRKLDEEKKAAERDVSIIYGEAFRVTFATVESADLPDEVKKKYINDPLARRLTFDPHVVIRFKIKDAVVFLLEIGDITEAVEQIREAAKGAVQAYAGKNTAAQMVENIDDVNTLLTKRVEILIGEKPTDTGEQLPWWGIDFKSASIISSGLPKRVNEAMADRGKAAFAAESAVATAEGEQQKREKEGAGTAKARELLLLAEAIGTKALAEVVKTEEGKLIIRLQALERAIRDGKVTILPADQSLLTAALSLKESLTKA